MTAPLEPCHTPDAGCPSSDALTFAATTSVVVGATLLGGYALMELLRRGSCCEVEL